MLRSAQDDPTHRRPRRRELRPEARLLLACAHVRPTARTDEEALAALREPIDWTLLLALATRHRVLPLVARHLPTVASGQCPAEVLADLRRRAYASAYHALRLSRELVEVLKLFAETGIPAAAFKGPVLAQVAYGDLALRTSTDIDLLVPRPLIARARSLLLARGYVPAFPTASPRQAMFLRSLTGERERAYLEQHGEHHLVKDEGRTNVDLHWSVALDALGLRLDPQTLWDRTDPIAFGGTTVRTLGAEDMLLVLCINGAKERWRQLQRACDLAEFIGSHPRIDWARAMGDAAAIGARRMLLLGVALAADLLDAAVPRDLVQRAHRDPAVRSLALATRRDLARVDVDPTDERTTVASCLFQLRLRDGAGDQARFALAQMRPTVGDWALVPLPGRLALLHYLIRPIRLLVSAL